MRDVREPPSILHNLPNVHYPSDVETAVTNKNAYSRLANIRGRLYILHLPLHVRRPPSK